MAFIGRDYCRGITYPLLLGTFPSGEYCPRGNVIGCKVIEPLKSDLIENVTRVICLHIILTTELIAMYPLNCDTHNTQKETIILLQFSSIFIFSLIFI